MNTTYISLNKKIYFGIIAPNLISSLGTKGDVETFFVLINDLINESILKNKYETISFYLYRSIINIHNKDDFKIQIYELSNEFKDIKSKHVNWSSYKFNKFDADNNYGKIRINTEKDNLYDVFRYFFVAMEKSLEMLEISIKRNKKLSRIIIGPIDIISSKEFMSLSDSDIINNSENPLWLRDDS